MKLFSKRINYTTLVRRGYDIVLPTDVYNKIEIIGKVNIAGEDFYKVKATQYVYDIERYFYFLIILDFSIDFIRPMKYIKFTDVWAVSRT